MLSSFVIAFLPRSKHLLISWLQSPSAVILEPKKIKSLTVSIVPSSMCHEVMGPDAMTFIFWMFSFLFFECWVLSLLFFTLLRHFHQEAPQFFAFYHKGSVICISEVFHIFGISPGNLDSSLCFIQPAFCMMYSACKLNKQGDNI